MPGRVWLATPSRMEFSMLYFESHITIEPVFDDRLELASKIAENHKFRIASLLMQKRKDDFPERSKHDTFMTGRNVNYDTLKENMSNLIVELKNNNFVVWRYKIEDVKLDSNFSDSLGLLS